MRLVAALLLVQVLTAPDPAQMEEAPDSGYRAVPHGLTLPGGTAWGAPSSVATLSNGHLVVFNRGTQPLLEFDRKGAFVRAMGEGLYTRPHGMKIDRADNIWTTDVAGHTVTKMSPEGKVLLVLGVKGQAGRWDEASGTRLLDEPTDVAFGPTGDIFVVQGHGRAEPRVLRFASSGAFIRAWGTKGTGPGQFDIAHAIVIDTKGLVYVADRQNRRVQIFDAEGTFLREWKFAGLPCGLHIGPDGRMYMVSGFAGQILELNANGSAIAAAGQPGKGLGEFGEAHYLTLGPGAEIYVADTVKPDLHKFVKR
jgi:sugar lactone lactonase YvrE